MKTTPIAAMEKTTGLHSLEERREEKLLRQTEKMKRLPSHPLYQKLQEPTKNRLKRQSINHSSKALQRKIQDVLPQNQQGIETLKDYEEWMTSNFDIRLELPNVKRKEDHSEPALKALTLETIYQQYPTNSWAHVYTDGSAEEAVRNGGGGVLMLFPDGTRSSKAVPTGKVSTNFRAESCALLEATRILNTNRILAKNTVILTDCKSMLQSVQGSRDRSQLLENIRKELTILSSKTNLVLQWIPSHCGIYGNEEADRLSKKGSKLDQYENPVSYDEAKTLLRFRSHFNNTGKNDSM